jgi:hypothetical protein
MQSHKAGHHSSMAETIAWVLQSTEQGAQDVPYILGWDPSRPPSNDGVRVQTFDQVMKAVILSEGNIRVQCITQAACVVPGGLGVVDMMGADFSVWQLDSGTCTLSIQDGTTLKNISEFDGTLNNGFLIQCLSNTAPSLSWDFSAGLPDYLAVRDGSIIQALGSMPAIVIPGATPQAGPAILNILCETGGGFDNSTSGVGVPVIQVQGPMATAGTLNLFLQNGPVITGFPIVGNDAPGNGIFNLTYDSTLDPTASNWPGALFPGGTFSAVALDLIPNLQYFPAVPLNWTGSTTLTIQQALDRIAAKIGPIP